MEHQKETVLVKDAELIKAEVDVKKLDLQEKDGLGVGNNKINGKSPIGGSIFLDECHGIPLEAWQKIEEDLKKPGLKKQLDYVTGTGKGKYKDLTTKDLDMFFKKTEFDPVGDKDWRDRAIGFIAELHKNFPVPEDQLKAAHLVSMYMQFGLTDEIDNIIKYYEIKAAKPKRR